MACSSCNETHPVIIQSADCSESCVDTIKTDCVIYSDDPLSFESDEIESGDKRNLTNLLKQISSKECPSVGSQIVEFNTTGDTPVSSYTVLSTDICKTILLTQVDDGTAGVITNTIVLPETAEFIDKELIFKDIAVPTDPTITTIKYQFDIPVQHKWVPAIVTSTDLDDLWDSYHKVLKIRLIKVTPTTYQWVVVNNSAKDIAEQITIIDDSVQELSGVVESLTTVSTVSFENVNLSNNWVTHALNVQAQKVGTVVKLRGYVKNGNNGQNIFTLPVGYRPPRLLTFPSFLDNFTPVIITVATSGVVYVTVSGVAANNPVSGYITLSGVNFHTI